MGDEGVITHAGKTTHGLDRFFASLYGQPVPGRAFFALSLVSLQQRGSFPLRVEQVVRSDAVKAASKAQAAAQPPKARGAQRRPGRPKGSQNQPKADGTFTLELVRLPGWLDALLHLSAGGLSLPYLGLDGPFGHHHALQIARQCGMPLIAKLRGEAARSFPYPGPYAGRGPHRQYGHQVAYDHLPWPSLQETTLEGPIQTCVYPAQLLHKEFPQPLNVVISAQTTLRTQARAPVVLFSRALDLVDAPLVDYDGWRCQIAFHFRDAKQSWGLADCMNVTPTGVTNAANLSLFMGHVADRLRTDGPPRAPDYSVLDLQAACRGYQYVEETIQLLPEKPEPVLLRQMLHKVAGVGRIHAAQPSFSFS